MNPEKGPFFLGSQFKDAVDVGQEGEANGHTASAIRKQREVNADPQITSTFKIIKSLLVEWHHPHLGRGFSI